MAKNFGAGYCIHCRRHFDQLTSDHIFPEAWYSDATPADLEKWQAPACKGCNAEYGKIERRLLQRMALATDPWVPGASGIGEKALRSFDPRVAKTEKDKKHRKAARDKMARESERVDVLPDVDVLLPNVGTIQEGTNGYLTIGVDEIDIGRFVKKIVLGITYLRTGTVLPAQYEVRVIRPSEHSKIPDEWLATSREIFERLPSFVVHRHYVPDDPFMAFFRFFLWERFEFVAAIIKKTVVQSEGDA